MFFSLSGKLLAFVAKEVIPFVLSVLIRDGFRRIKKKVEKEEPVAPLSKD